MKKAIFPGSFDPITLGHYNVIMRGANLFDEVVVAIGTNASKTYMFSLEERFSFIENTFKNKPNVSVASYEGLTIEFCKTINANYILRGLRNTSDFEYEKQIAQANASVENSIETVMMLTSLETSFLSSSIVRDIIRNDGDYKPFVPESVRVQ